MLRSLPTVEVELVPENGPDECTVEYKSNTEFAVDSLDGTSRRPVSESPHIRIKGKAVSVKEQLDRIVEQHRRESNWEFEPGQ